MTTFIFECKDFWQKRTLCNSTFYLINQDKALDYTRYSITFHKDMLLLFSC